MNTRTIILGLILAFTSATQADTTSQLIDLALSEKSSACLVTADGMYIGTVDVFLGRSGFTFSIRIGGISLDGLSLARTAGVIEDYMACEKITSYDSIDASPDERTIVVIEDYLPCESCAEKSSYDSIDAAPEEKER